MIRHRWLVTAGGAAAIALWVGAVARTTASLTCPAPPSQDGSAIVRTNLARIGTILYTYANENNSEFPAHLSALVTLWPDYVSPSMFWNPGDSDPCPTFIDNDERNTPNSTQVSFRYFGGTADYRSYVVLQDDTLANNGGTGVHALLSDSNVYFFTPMDSTPPSAAVGRDRLEQIALALNDYAGDHGGNYPPALSALFPAYISDPLIFWNPGDTYNTQQSPPTTINNDNPRAPNSAQISYAYLGAGRTTSDDPQAILVQDNSTANNGGGVINIRTIGSSARSYIRNLTCNSTATCRALALRNLRAIGAGMYTYANENADDFPPRLSMLMESGAQTDPDIFWNPGDSDPRPLVIDNDLPEQPNSTQISCAYFGGRGDFPGAAVVLQDNSLANNQGQGLLVLTADMRAEFYEKSTQTHPSIETAKANLVQMGQALHAWAGDHGGQFPAKLSLLFPAYIADPAVFWNPGDANPAPTTINNDTPNALNSAQISYHYRGAGFTSAAPPQFVLVSDNSIANNFGSGINVLTVDSQVDFYTPEVVPCASMPICEWAAAGKLSTLLRGLYGYATEQQGLLPPVLSAIYPTYIARPGDFWDQTDTQAPPLTIDNDVPDAPNSAQISFQYLGAGLNIDQVPASTVLIRDETLANNGGDVILEARADGSVHYVRLRQATQITIIGPDTVTAGSTAHYTCMATFDDGTVRNVTTPWTAWLVDGCCGAFTWPEYWWLLGPIEQAAYEANPLVPADTPVTIKAIHYPGGGFTELIATRTIAVLSDADGEGVPDPADSCPETVPGAAVDANGCPPIVYGDSDHDGDVDDADRAVFDDCRSGPNVAASTACAAALDRDADGDVDLDDYGVFQRCYSGACTPAPAHCSD